MNNSIKIKTENTDGYTVYVYNEKLKFRIKQLGDHSFIVERTYAFPLPLLFNFFIKKTVSWEPCDSNGYTAIMGVINEHKTKEEAEKWITDFFKYPIIH